MLRILLLKLNIIINQVTLLLAMMQQLMVQHKLSPVPLPEEKFFSQKEAAHRIGKTPRTIRRYVLAGKLPETQRNSHPYYRQSDLDKIKDV